MFRRDSMPCPHNAALEQREGRFHGVCVHVAMRVLLRVIDGLVLFLRELIQGPRVDSRFICDNHFHMTANVLPDNLAHSGGSLILSADQTQVPITLPDADDNLLVRTGTPAALLAAYVVLVNFDGAAEFWRGHFQHRSPDAMAQIPRCSVSCLEHPLHLERRH